MTPLNASNRSVPSDDSDFDAQVLLEQEPADRAVEDGWDTQYVRSPTGSSTDQRTVGIQPASLKRFTDGTVPSTTGTLSWRARHVKPGSTAGPWTSWVKGRPRTEPGSSGQSFAGAPDPAITLDSFQVFDDGSDIDYTVTFTPNGSVNDGDHSAEATFVGTDGTVAATATESSPVSNTTMTATDTGAGDGSASTSFHRVDLDLKDSNGSVIGTAHTRTLETV